MQNITSISINAISPGQRRHGAARGAPSRRRRVMSCLISIILLKLYISERILVTLVFMLLFQRSAVTAPPGERRHGAAG